MTKIIKQAVDEETNPLDLEGLGILENDHLHDEERHPVVRGRGAKGEAIAVCEMVSLHQNVPFRRDMLQKVLEGQFRRNKGLSLELMAGLCELLGMSSQLAKTSTSHINSVEAPALISRKDPSSFLRPEKIKINRTSKFWHTNNSRISLQSW